MLTIFLDILSFVNDIDIPIYNLISYNFEHLDGHGLNNVQWACAYQWSWSHIYFANIYKSNFLSHFCIAFVFSMVLHQRNSASLSSSSMLYSSIQNLPVCRCNSALLWSCFCINRIFISFAQYYINAIFFYSKEIPFLWRYFWGNNHRTRVILIVFFIIHISQYITCNQY